MNNEAKKFRVAILGASGYTGADLVRLLVRHPAVEIAVLTAERKAGEEIGRTFPHLATYALPDLASLDEVEWAGLDVDVVFCALPHAASQAVIKGLFHAVGDSFLEEMVAESRADLIAAAPGDVRVIDLSADFRLRDPKTYEEWYGQPHDATALQGIAVYGLSEHYREAIRSARLVACPGCYPTAALLALLPLLHAEAISPHGIIIDAKSGVSGAGRALKEQNLFCEVAEAIHPYGLTRHRHMPEIEQELERAAGRALTISFTPHLVPMNRGELETIYVTLAPGKTAADLRALLVERYGPEPFVHVLPEGVAPSTRHVRGSNHCVLNVFADRNKDRAIVVAAIDNLVKGSSGQAVQNMNLMLGLEETLGLGDAPLFP
ncbi:MAG: N-acetyl-gamma-glutamyl-phosphate reductase [Pseudomonadota bacterium]